MSRTDSAWASTRDAEHAFARLAAPLGRQVVSACTHFAASTSMVLVSVEVDGRGIEALGAGEAGDVERVRALHAERRGGRLFAFAGHQALTGVLAVGDLLERSAVDQVVMIGHREVLPATQLIDTQSFVRPELADGLVRLVVRPAAGGLVVPFEQPNPTPCCADH